MILLEEKIKKCNKRLMNKFCLIQGLEDGRGEKGKRGGPKTEPKTPPPTPMGTPAPLSYMEKR